MKITICGSTAFISEMESLAKSLGDMGHEVQFPPVHFEDNSGKLWHTKDYYKFKKTEPFNDEDFKKTHAQRIRDHFDKVAWSEAVLVADYDKNNLPNYIGPNTLMEMGLAFHLGKKIYLLQPIPNLQWKEEIVGLGPIVISGDLGLIV